MYPTFYINLKSMTLRNADSWCSLKIFRSKFGSIVDNGYGKLVLDFCRSFKNSDYNLVTSFLSKVLCNTFLFLSSKMIQRTEASLIFVTACAGSTRKVMFALCLSMGAGGVPLAPGSWSLT